MVTNITIAIVLKKFFKGKIEFQTLFRAGKDGAYCIDIKLYIIILIQSEVDCMLRKPLLMTRDIQGIVPGN